MEDDDERISYYQEKYNEYLSNKNIGQKFLRKKVSKPKIYKKKDN
jgi:hypothetical protein